MKIDSLNLASAMQMHSPGLASVDHATAPLHSAPNDTGRQRVTGCLQKRGLKGSGAVG
jgi:hypothetical protein